MLYSLLFLAVPDFVQGPDSSVISMVAAFFALAALLASGICLYLAFRIFNMLQGAPRLADSFGFEKYQGSALDEVCKLRESVNQLGGKFGAALRSVNESVRQTQTSISDYREQMQTYGAISNRLQKDLDDFREGFLTAHLDCILGRILDLQESVGRLDGVELKKAIIEHMDAICELMLVAQVPEKDLLGMPVRDAVGLCEIIESIDTDGPEDDGRIASVISPAFIVNGTPGGPRVLRKARVGVFKQKAPTRVSPPVAPEKDNPSNGGNPAPSTPENGEPAVKETEA